MQTDFGKNNTETELGKLRETNYSSGTKLTSQRWQAVEFRSTEYTLSRLLENSHYTASVRDSPLGYN